MREKAAITSRNKPMQTKPLGASRNKQHRCKCKQVRAKYDKSKPVWSQILMQKLKPMVLITLPGT